MKRSNCRHFFLLTMLVLLAVNGAVPTQAYSQSQGTNNPNLLQEAENLYRAQRYEEALQRYEHYLRTSPRSSSGNMPGCAPPNSTASAATGIRPGHAMNGC